ncbi:hypothetical protein CMU66_18400 [Elizabethkingia anophelis]|nr:hypothetical protein [Elizabethkingia anophelis]MDV3565231.1 hypothetical protein [Elizabethkingia anophelis]MDV3624359.1 hypothetical protein [Elizabethkingia anophelis]MDV3644138.1 hypothetical protein [Elizabethkingia anophelis]MDV3658791.1 hypothetical protein [Elizabethkingia anophelis]
MAIDKKYIGKITESNLDDWLHSTGFLYPVNERQLERFNKLYEDYDFKLKSATIDIKSIIEGTLCNREKIIPLDINKETSNEIENLKMVARKGQNNLPQHIIDKMKKKHRNSDDTDKL